MAIDIDRNLCTQFIHERRDFKGGSFSSNLKMTFIFYLLLVWDAKYGMVQILTATMPLIRTIIKKRLEIISLIISVMQFFKTIKMCH